MFQITVSGPDSASRTRMTDQIKNLFETTGLVVMRYPRPNFVPEKPPVDVDVVIFEKDEVPVAANG